VYLAPKLLIIDEDIIWDGERVSRRIVHGDLHIFHKEKDLTATFQIRVADLQIPRFVRCSGWPHITIVAEVYRCRLSPSTLRGPSDRSISAFAL
jgi:hypothetical protein